MESYIQYRLGQFVILKRDLEGYMEGECLQYAGQSELSPLLINLYDPYLVKIITVFIYDVQPDDTFNSWC